MNKWFWIMKRGLLLALSAAVILGLCALTPEAKAEQTYDDEIEIVDENATDEFYRWVFTFHYVRKDDNSVTCTCSVTYHDKYSPEGDSLADNVPVEVTGSFVTPTTCLMTSGTVHASYTVDRRTADSSWTPGDRGPHLIEPVEGQDATCTADGYNTHYKCVREGCEKLFTDSLGENETNLENLKNGEKLGHDWAVDTTQGEQGWDWEFTSDSISATAYLKCQRNNCGQPATVTNNNPDPGENPMIRAQARCPAPTPPS